jgi:hypothetical protein
VEVPGDVLQREMRRYFLFEARSIINEEEGWLFRTTVPSISFKSAATVAMSSVEHHQLPPIL